MEMERDPGGVQAQEQAGVWAVAWEEAAEGEEETVRGRVPGGFAYAPNVGIRSPTQRATLAIRCPVRPAGLK